MALWSDEEVTQFRRWLYQYIVGGQKQAREQIAKMFVEKAPHLAAEVQRRHKIPYEDCRDIVQEAILRAVVPESLRNLWDKYGNGADPAAYLRLKVKGKVSDYFKRSRLDIQPTERCQNGEWYSVEIAAPGPGTEEIAIAEVMQEARLECIRECFAKLSESDQQIIRLVRIQKYNANEAAQHLGIEHTAARKRLERAEERLRHCVERCLEVKGWRGENDETG